jgi:hypothetical protein
MANVLSPRILLRGFVVFVCVSLLGFVAVLIYGNNLPAFFHALGEVHWIWIVVAVGSPRWTGLAAGFAIGSWSVTCTPTRR